LTEAKIETTGPALVRYFRELTPTPADRERLTELVRRLGDDDFDAREKAAAELLRAGRKALPFLLAVENDKDLERARRAGQLIQEVRSGADLARAVAAA